MANSYCTTAAHRIFTQRQIRAYMLLLATGLGKPINAAIASYFGWWFIGEFSKQTVNLHLKTKSKHQ
ncbi:hypothetical protein C7N43_05910 [Sphingobacteriales bacterium UPWRP_1]|nr:hypothetical protein BVG80_05680 [Sphingobacteriales bacterium TSM_CSM]PSJ77990.1 hypothetical protein C7N43_05910 [Sphingobacteriales bacterium UPWRP_1]